MPSVAERMNPFPTMLDGQFITKRVRRGAITLHQCRTIRIVGKAFMPSVAERMNPFPTMLDGQFITKRVRRKFGKICSIGDEEWQARTPCT